jgi:hypothetical protein
MLLSSAAGGVPGRAIEKDSVSVYAACLYPSENGTRRSARPSRLAGAGAEPKSNQELPVLPSQCMIPATFACELLIRSNFADTSGSKSAASTAYR